MIATDWRQLRFAAELHAVDIPLADPHFLDDAGFGSGRAVLPRVGTDLGIALKQSLRHLTRDVYSCCRGGSRRGYCDRYTLDMAGRPASNERSAKNRRREADSPGRTRDLALSSTWARSRQRTGSTNKSRLLGARDDAMAMQYSETKLEVRPEASMPLLIPGLT